MSRIGKQPIAVPPKVKVEVKGRKFQLKGRKRQTQLGTAKTHCASRLKAVRLS